MHNAEIDRKLELCIESFKSVLYEKDETFLENMAKTNIDQGNVGVDPGRGAVRPVEAV